MIQAVSFEKSPVTHEIIIDRKICSLNTQPIKTASAKSGQRRLRTETQSSSHSLPAGWELEAEADKLMLAPDDSFFSPWARYDHFKNAANLYRKAALEAEIALDYERGAALHIKEALVYTQKLSEYSVAIFFLKESLPLYQSQNQQTEVKLFYDQIISFFDEEYEKLKRDLGEISEDSHFVNSDIARNRIRKAAIYEELGSPSIEWEKLYKEAADILLQQAQENPDVLYDRDAALSYPTVAAMCLEKIPEYAGQANEIYSQELSSWLDIFDTYLKTSPSYEDEHKAYQLIETLMISKGGKFLSIKANCHETYLKLAEKEIMLLEDLIFSPTIPDEWKGILICLDKIACQSLIKYLESYGHDKKAAIEEKLAVLEKYIQSKDASYREAIETYLEAEEIQDTFQIFDTIIFSPPLSVEATISLLSKGVHL